MNSFLFLLLTLSAAAAETDLAQPKATPTPSPAAHTIEILIAGPEGDRSTMEEAIRPLIGSGLDVRWSGKERLPVDESLPTSNLVGSAQIWIDVANPIRLRVYLPALETTGAATVRTVERPESDDADLVVRETVAQIVKAAVLALRGDGPATPVEPKTAPQAVLAPTLPPPQTTADLVERPTSASQGHGHAGRLSFVLAGGLHTSPLNLAEPAGDKDWLGPAVVGAVRWHLEKYVLAVRMSWETSDRSVDLYYLKNTFLSGTVGASRFFDAGVASFGIGLEAGVLVLHQNTWLTDTGSSRAANLPGQMGQTNATGMLFGPVAEFNLAPTPRLFLHLDVGVPIAILYAKDDYTSGWKESPYFRATIGIGFRL